MGRIYEEYFTSEADGLRISAMAVLPETEPYRGVVQLLFMACANTRNATCIFMKYLARLGMWQ